MKPVQRTRDLIVSGSTPTEVRRMRRINKRLTWGAYVPRNLTPQEEYVARCQAVLDRLQPSAALAGPSAAAMYHLPLVGAVPSTVYVRNIVRGRYASDVEVLPDGPAMKHDGINLSAPEFTVFDCARLLCSRDALIVADGALAGDLCSVEQLRQVATDVTGRHGASRMRWVAANADPLAESPGETWTRLLATGLGYELRSQVQVRDGEREARLDFLVGGTLVALEFDGAIKYERKGAVKVILQLLRDGDLQALGYNVLHFVWLQLDNAKQLDARLRHAGAVPTRRPRSIGW